MIKQITLKDGRTLRIEVVHDQNEPLTKDELDVLEFSLQPLRIILSALKTFQKSPKYCDQLVMFYGHSLQWIVEQLAYTLRGGQ